VRHPSNLLFAAGCILLTHCLVSQISEAIPHGQVLESLATQVALSHYDDFTDTSEAMAQACVALCGALDEGSLSAAREAWWAARQPWKRAEVVQFGPVVEYPLRLGPKLDDWPVNGEAVEEMVAGELPLDQAGFDAMGSATRGLPVVEHLLWADVGGDDALVALSGSTRRCEALMGVTADVAENAARLRDAWDADWVLQLSDPEAVDGSLYDDTQAVVDEWVNRMAFTVENIRLRKLGKPAGDDANGTMQPDIIESRLSGRSLDDARDALQGVIDVWTGPPGEGQVGIRELVRVPGLVAQLDLEFTDAVERLDSLSDPFEALLMSEPDTVAWAQEPLLQLQVTIQGDLASAVGVTITFNDADGD